MTAYRPAATLRMRSHKQPMLRREHAHPPRSYHLARIITAIVNAAQAAGCDQVETRSDFLIRYRGLLLSSQLRKQTMALFSRLQAKRVVFVYVVQILGV